MDSFSFPSPDQEKEMDAVVVASDTFLLRLDSISVSKIASEWKFQKELNKLKLAIRSIKHEKFFDYGKVSEMLKDTLYDTDNLLDEYQFYNLQSHLSINAGKSKNYLVEVSKFLSGINRFAFQVWMNYKLNMLIKRLYKILMHRVPASYYVWPPFSPHRQKGITYSHSFLRDGEILGRENDKDRVVNALLELEIGESISVLSIVGVGGIGKTTLAKLVYNDERIIKHFQYRIWVSVSREFDVKKIIERIIESASGNRNGMTVGNYDIAELQNVLKDALHEKKYLLVLDNVWNEDIGKWNELKILLNVGANGSKIIVTTRIEAVASVLGTKHVHCLKGISDENCLSLFLSKAFEQGEDRERPDLLTIAAEIVQKCEGVPLIAMILGGSLYMETDEYVWKRVRDHHEWNSSQQNDIVLPAIKVGYEQLPSYLKACLAYCSMFPKDHDIEIDKLIQLWMAEGLIHPSAECPDLEVTGIQYFNEFWRRSFFQNIEKNRPFLTSVCKMHDLVHDLALSVAETEFLVIGSTMQIISGEVRHVAFADYDPSAKELPRSLLQHHMLRTIYFQVGRIGPSSSSFVEACISKFRHLWVLDLSDSSFEVLPNSIGELKHLRYFDISGNGSITFLPDSLCNLLSLQTLRINLCTNLNGLPKALGNIISLRHLHITIKQEMFPVEIGCLSSLCCLSISGCQNLVSLSEGLQYLTHLHTLAIVDCPKLSFLPNSMKNLTALENLLIINCEELTLFEWQDIEGMKILRSLVIGGLDELEAKDVQSLKSLRSLVIGGLPRLVDLPHWLHGTSNTLQHLRIARCPSLMILPKWLEEFTALEKIEIIECLKLSTLPDGVFSLGKLELLKIDSCPRFNVYDAKSRANPIQVKEIYLDGILIQ